MIPEFHNRYTELFEGLERNLATKGKADFGTANDHAAFNFLAWAFYSDNPVDTELGSDGPKLVSKWYIHGLAAPGVHYFHHSGPVLQDAAWVAGQYAHINFSDPNNFQRASRSIVVAMHDQELLVRVYSVFALRSFVEACNDLGEIRPILPKLLNGGMHFCINGISILLCIVHQADLDNRNLLVVDVGGSTGFTTLGIVKHVNARNVTILDQSPHQLAKAKKEPLKECRILEGDAEDLPFPTDSVDRYVSAGSIECWPDPQRGIREAY